jgi:hypothetical protein
MISNGQRAKWTVEKLAADYDYIDVLWFYRLGLLANNWGSFVPMLRWPQVSKIRASRYLILVEWHDRPDPQQIRVSWTRCKVAGLVHKWELKQLAVRLDELANADRK